MAPKLLAALLLAAALGACSELTADAPLFTVEDQRGPPPLTEGIWIAVGEECPAHYARRRSGKFPEECGPLELRRTEDGLWRATVRVDLVTNLSRDRQEEVATMAPMRVALVPIPPQPREDMYARLYVAEYQPTDPGEPRIGYALIAPLGSMPATEALISPSIGCEDILREGPIEGVQPRYARQVAADGTESQRMAGCTAYSQAAVREAARRALPEDLDTMLERRWTYVRPN